MHHSVNLQRFQISRPKESIVGNNTLGEVRNLVKDKFL